MSLPDLPWAWIAALAAVAVVAFLAGRGQGRGRGHRGPGYAPVQGAHDAGASQAGEQRALLTAANAVRDALDKQAREMGELRTFWSRRLDELERRVDALDRAPGQGRDDVAEGRLTADQAVYGGTYDLPAYGGGSAGWQPAAGLEPAWSPGPGDQPVEVRDGVLVASRSLPPAGYLSAVGTGRGRVYLNADVPLSEFSLPKWQAFFDLQGARAYAAYRTLHPAEVQWDEGMGRGELISKGLAEAI